MSPTITGSDTGGRRRDCRSRSGESFGVLPLGLLHAWVDESMHAISEQLASPGCLLAATVAIPPSVTTFVMPCASWSCARHSDPLAR